MPNPVILQKAMKALPFLLLSALLISYLGADETPVLETLELSGEQIEKERVLDLNKNLILLNKNYVIPVGKTLVVRGSGQIKPAKGVSYPRIEVSGRLIMGGPDVKIRKPDYSKLDTILFGSVTIVNVDKKAEVSGERVRLVRGIFRPEEGRVSMKECILHETKLDLDELDPSKCLFSIKDSMVAPRNWKINGAPSDFIRNFKFDGCQFYGDNRIPIEVLWCMKDCDIYIDDPFPFTLPEWEAPAPLPRMYFKNKEFEPMFREGFKKVRGFRLALASRPYNNFEGEEEARGYKTEK